MQNNAVHVLDKERAARMGAMEEAVRRMLDLETFDARGRDALDFHERSVVCLRDAVRFAFDAGFAAATEAGATAEPRPAAPPAVIPARPTVEVEGFIGSPQEFRSVAHGRRHDGVRGLVVRYGTEGGDSEFFLDYTGAVRLFQALGGALDFLNRD